jgi:hypothetical protein
MNRKHLGVAVCVLLSAGLLVGCSDDKDPPTVVLPSSTTVSVTATTTVPKPSVVTVLPVPTVQPSPVVSPTVQPPASASQLPVNCSDVLHDWNVEPDDTGNIGAEPGVEVVSVRVGQQACYDTVIIDVDTTKEIGSHVAYAIPSDSPTYDGSGLPVTPAMTGGAVLQVSVFAPARNLEASGAPYQYSAEYFAGWTSLREVRFGLPDYEGYSSFFIGVVAENAFAVTTWMDHGIRKIIIRVAH